MENASKALIIAGAILLAILIIGLGMGIFNQARDAMGNSGMDAQKLATYNAPFLNEEGTRTGVQVKALLDTVMNHNYSHAGDPTLQVGITGLATEAVATGSNEIDNSKIATYKGTIIGGKKYKVECVRATDGRVLNITITATT